MKRRPALVLVACLVGACSQPVPTTQGDASDARFQKVLATIQADMDAYGVAGAAVAIVVDGKLQASAGLGVTARGGHDRVRPTTLFRVASLSKMVLAATAMTFVEQGQLTLTDPVTNYVPLTLAPGFDPSTIPLTTLLDHTSGVPDFDVLICPVGYGQLATYMNAHPKSLWSTPGQVWNYSNRNFSILGWVLETVGAQPFEQLVESRVLRPAGMTTATYDVAAAKAADHAVGDEGGQSYDVDAYDCEMQHPPAGIIASVIDYAQLSMMLLASGGGVLQPSSVAAMETQHADTDQAPGGAQAYGYGLEMFAGTNARMIHHEGALPGFRTALRLLPAQNFAVVVFYNSGDRDANEVAQEATRIYLGDHITDGPFGTPPLSSWGRYAGTYVDPIELGTITVSFDGTNLTASNVGAPSGLVFAPQPLLAGDGDQFQLGFTDGNSTAVTFYPSANQLSHWFVTRSGVGERQP
ncbi:MAG TPA: serine hydrolase domain-containing protein [Polyangia bacterium]|jgi:CubicO group peptidase (beta-lactamase class C family)|nr:serine hydrolase domain-containing protein [Polyangia bacterium]